MSIPAFSADWADAFLRVINADTAYLNAAKGWTNPVALIVQPTAALPSGAAVQLDLRAGVCHGAAALAPDAVTAPFVLTADLPTWIDVVQGAADPIMSVARGKVKLTSGSLGTLMLHAKAAKALVACAQQIETRWPSA
jgi:putative sterol carrier protein